MDAKHIQKKMHEMQSSESIQELFGKLVSGRKGYKAVIEVAKPAPKCSCGNILSGEENFCPECGLRVEKK